MKKIIKKTLVYISEEYATYMNYSDKKCANCLKFLIEDEDRC